MIRLYCAAAFFIMCGMALALLVYYDGRSRG